MSSICHGDTVCVLIHVGLFFKKNSNLKHGFVPGSCLHVFSLAHVFEHVCHMVLKVNVTNSKLVVTLSFEFVTKKCTYLGLKN